MEEFKAGAIRAAKVFAWVTASAIVSYLLANGVDAIVPGFSKNWPVLILVINPLLAGVKDWLAANAQK